RLPSSSTLFPYTTLFRSAMGEVASARTDRELSELRATIDSDIRLLRERITEDVDPRRLARRNPLAVFGALASVIAIGGVTTMRGDRKSTRLNSSHVAISY